MRQHWVKVKLITGLLVEIAILFKLTVLSAVSPPQITTIQFGVTDYGGNRGRSVAAIAKVESVAAHSR